MTCSLLKFVQCNESWPSTASLTSSSQASWLWGSFSLQAIGLFHFQSKAHCAGSPGGRIGLHLVHRGPPQSPTVVLWRGDLGLLPSGRGGAGPVTTGAFLSDTCREDGVLSDTACLRPQSQLVRPSAPPRSTSEGRVSHTSQPPALGGLAETLQHLGPAAVGGSQELGLRVTADRSQKHPCPPFSGLPPRQQLLAFLLFNRFL